MKTIITSTRIPANQANGSYNILLPGNFGQPKGFLVYAMPYSVQPNNFDSTTTFPCISVGFGGSNISGTGLTNACAWTSNQDGADPTSSRASFGNTVSVFSTNIAGSVFRQWQMTNFGQNIIFGTYTSGGTQAEPIDLVFTVFGGDDFQCAVGQTAIVAAINTLTLVGTPFQPDAILFSHARPAQITDAQMTFGASVRNINSLPSGLGFTNVTSTSASMWRNQDNQGTSIVQTRVSDTGTFNFATNSVVRFHSMYNSGFAVTQSTANSGNSIIFLAMKAGSGDTTFPNFTLQTNPQIGENVLLSFNACHIIGTYARYSGVNATVTTSALGADSMSYFTANGFRKSNSVGIGTFTSSTSSTTVTGVGTSFLQQLGVLDNIYDTNYQLVGIVSSITSNTSLLLQSNAAITSTGSSLFFEKPKQFSMSYGNRAQDGGGNASMRTYFSDEAFIQFTATTPTITARGRVVDFFDYSPGFPVANSVRGLFSLTNNPFGYTGWQFGIRNDQIGLRRGGIS